jgi:type IV fimbrial biogenesis protein FimT
MIAQSPTPLPAPGTPDALAGRQAVSRLRSCSGVTIAELVTVITLIGIFIVVAAPTFMELIPIYRLSGATRQIGGDLMWARMQAIAQNNNFRVIFTNSQQSYRIHDDNDNDGVEDSGEWTSTRTLANFPAVSFTSTASHTIFTPRGSASRLTITLRNSSGTEDIEVRLSGAVNLG